MPADDCHYFPQGLWLPSQPQSVTASWLVPSYTAWWQSHIGVNNLPKVVTQLLPRLGFEPTTCWSQVQRCIRYATVQTTNRKCYMAYQIATFLMTLSDLENHSHSASLAKCDDMIWTHDLLIASPTLCPVHHRASLLGLLLLCCQMYEFQYWYLSEYIDSCLWFVQHRRFAKHIVYQV